MKRLFVLLIACIFIGSISAKPKAKKQPLRVACIGNSITYGTAIDDREHYAYPVQLQQMLGDNYIVGNFGKPGATLLRRGHRPYVEQQEWTDAKAFNADIAVIHLGINDTDPRNWPNYRDDFIPDYCALIDTLRMINPKVRVIIAELTPLSHRHPRFQSGTRDWREEITAEVRMVAKARKCQLIDFFTPLYSRPELLTDGIHPNAEGAGLLAKAAYQGITGDFGGLQMPAWYSDNMMMQYGEPFCCKGKANAEDKVSVTFTDGKGYKYEATATPSSETGEWCVSDNDNVLEAGKTYTLTVSTQSKTLVFKNILAGDIWLCSGQSNMAFQLHSAATAQRDIPKAKNPNIRLLNIRGRWDTSNTEWPVEVLDSVNRLQYMDIPQWTECTPETASVFSAIGYYFGKELNDSTGIPIGLVCNAVGGTPIEAWIDRNTLEHEFPAILNDWKNNDFIQDWVRGRAKKNIAQANNPLQRHPYEPCYMYEAGMLPLEGMPVTGVIWYQGESNAHNYEAHEKLFSLLSQSFHDALPTRDAVTQPFYFVQLSSLNRPSWPWFRDSQRRLANAYTDLHMVVTTDVGDSLDVHPTRKAEVGHRLALQALYDTYEHHDLIPSGPEVTGVEIVGNEVTGIEVVVSFNWAEGLATSDGKAPSTFEVADYDKGIFYPAEARIEGDKVVLTCKEIGNAGNGVNVVNGVIVRYGWQPFTRANLINRAGLPASTFRMDSHFENCTY